MRAGWSRATSFLLAALAWSLGLFALLRSPWVQGLLVLPLTRLQEQAADYYACPPPVAVAVTADCSGTDVLALCLAAILACPVSWRARIAGATGGIALVLTLNTLRIATLGRAASSPALFQALHLQVWPAILVLATAGYVFAWMRKALGATGRTEKGDTERGALFPLLRRFAPRAAVLLVAWALCAPWIASSEALLEAGAWTARAAAFFLAAAGLAVAVSGNVLSTSRGAFAVTPECLATALIPLYVAGVLTVRLTWPWRAVALMAAPPLFATLAILRLLTLALPPALAATPLFIVHGFHQLVLAVIGVWLLALWREPPAPWRWARAAGRAGAALGAAAIIVIIAGAALTSAVLGAARAIASVAPHTLTELAAPGDAQGALALLPAYQAGLLLAIGMTTLPGWRRFLSAFGVLLASQVVFLVVVGELTDHAGLVVHALLLRAWAVGVPVALTLVMLRGAPSAVGKLAYRRFWHEVGESFPDLGGAASTAYYFENEKRLLSEHVPDLGRCAMLKTDLWDEVKNTRILQWVHEQGAAVFGVDISEPTVRQARAAFSDAGLRAAIADVRRLPFRDGSFDAVYSMGTIEHFRDPDTALREIYRVLRPGGRAVVGVPNRWDPFLRPLLASSLQALGLYGYGYERSFSRRALRRMLRSAGFEVVTETAILFVPGWLRMADLALHCHFPQLAPVTAAMLKPFAWLDRHAPAVRRHGYLLASVGVRPAR